MRRWFKILYVIYKMSSTEENGNTQERKRKWKDPEYVRAYYRDYHRKRRVYKLHPYKLDDGRKWSDVHPFPPEFETKEAWEQFKKDRNSKYERTKSITIYVPVPKQKCELCDVEIKGNYWGAHINSTKHKKNEKLLERHGVLVV